MGMNTQTAVPVTGLRSVEFRLSDDGIPPARLVRLVGSFDNWGAGSHVLVHGSDGWWVVSIQLAPGTYYYSFLVDGIPRSDPAGSGGRVAEWGGDYSVRIVP